MQAIATTVVGSDPQPDWLVDRAPFRTHVVPRIRMPEVWRVGPPWLEEAQSSCPVSHGRPTGVPVCERGTMSDDILTEDGFLVLADISGFTAFVTATELEHGAQVTGILLETVMRGLSPPLEIQELEGDAVFALGPDRIITDGSALPALMGNAFAAFTEDRRRLASDASCGCGACRDTARLSLKLIAHHGRFVRQLVGGRSRVTGPDVVLAHRLLKNPAGAGAYLLLTEPALERIGMDPVARGMRRHVVSYPHLGEVSCFIGDLEPDPRPALAGAGQAA